MKYLIVDDDPASRELLKDILAPYGSCDMVFGGSEAIDVVYLALEDHNPYDLVCLDIMMPGTDGHEVLDAIRALEHQQGIHGSDGTKVIMTTALRDSKHCVRAFTEGCESYVTKPIDEQQLLDQVQGLLGELRDQRPPSQSEAEPATTCSAAPGRHPAQRSRARYLIVDDDRVCRELLKDMLARYGRCGFAYDGAEAIEAVRLALEENDPYEMVCLDIMMPGASGHDALQGIRKIEAEHGIHGLDGVKVIMTTALCGSKHCIQSFREGCESYVTKPVEESQLLGRMRELKLLPERQ